MSRISATVTRKKWEALIRNDRVNEVVGYCALCGKEANGLNWCFGCGAFICEECDETCVAGFNHIPKDHKESDDLSN